MKKGNLRRKKAGNKIEILSQNKILP